MWLAFGSTAKVPAETKNKIKAPATKGGGQGGKTSLMLGKESSMPPGYLLMSHRADEELSEPLLARGPSGESTICCHELLLAVPPNNTRLWPASMGIGSHESDRASKHHHQKNSSSAIASFSQRSSADPRRPSAK